jgi:murein DD-endopeptidase MepM/ murein hydrolase activator NlpD
MRPLLEWCSAVALSRLSIVIPVAIGAAGCSDASRFSDPYANPYASRGAVPEVTSSVAPAQPAPVGRVDTQPFGGQPMPPPGPGAPGYYAPGAAAYPPQGPDYGPRGPDYAPRFSDYPPRDYPPRAGEYPPPNYPPREIGAAYPPRGTEYPQQAPNLPPRGPDYAPRGAQYPPQAPDYPPRRPDYPPGGPDYSPRGPDYPPRGLEGGPRPDTTGEVSSPPTRAMARSDWGLGGATAVTVGPGDTIDGIAKRYGVSRAALMAANHLSASATIRRGQQIVIPRQSATAIAGARPMPPMPPQAPPPAPPVARALPPAPAAGAGEGIHVVAAGETLSSIAHRYHRSRAAIARANNIEPDARLHIAQRLVIPGGRPATVRIGGLESTTSGHPPASQGNAAPVLAQAPDVGPPPSPPAAQKLVASGPGQSARVTTATTSEPIGAEATAVSQAAAVTPQFRWPVHGRIISGFGPKAAGQPNDGINVAVPEGTVVKAADDGIVAYAGNELKGYGNLILVRHPNGFVTAYANASELMVRRGDPVKRGQVIARSGQTGTVSSPQLHFEIRKGATPVDPTQYLSGT